MGRYDALLVMDYHKHVFAISPWPTQLPPLVIVDSKTPAGRGSHPVLDALPRIDWLLVNDEEVLRLRSDGMDRTERGPAARSGPRIMRAIEEIAARFPATRNIVVKRASRGLLWWQRRTDEIAQIPSRRRYRHDVIGAGDVLAAHLARELVHGARASSALLWAAAWAEAHVRINQTILHSERRRGRDVVVYGIVPPSVAPRAPLRVARTVSARRPDPP